MPGRLAAWRILIASSSQRASRKIPSFSNFLNVFPCLVILVRCLIRHARIKTSSHSSTTHGSNNARAFARSPRTMGKRRQVDRWISYRASKSPCR